MRHFRTIIIFACYLAVLTPGCGAKDTTPQRPITQAIDRTRHKIGRVDLIVQDTKRADKVKETYKMLEALLLQANEEGSKRRQHLMTVDTSNSTESEIRAIFAAEAVARDKTLDGYFALQIQLRENLTESEFKQLDAVR